MKLIISKPTNAIPERGKKRKLDKRYLSDRYYLTATRSDKNEDLWTISLNDILTLDGKVSKTWQFTYITDINWLLTQYPDEASIVLFIG